MNSELRKIAENCTRNRWRLQRLTRVANTITPYPAQGASYGILQNRAGTHPGLGVRSTTKLQKAVSYSLLGSRFGSFSTLVFMAYFRDQAVESYTARTLGRPQRFCLTFNWLSMIRLFGHA